MGAGDPGQREAAARRRGMAATLLRHAAPFVEAATRDGLADLSHVSSLITAELGAIDGQDAIDRMALSASPPAAAALGGVPVAGDLESVPADASINGHGYSPRPRPRPTGGTDVPEAPARRH